MEKKLVDLIKKLLYECGTGSNVHEEEIHKLLSSLFTNISSDFSAYKEFFGGLLKVVEKTEERSVQYLIDHFASLYKDGILELPIIEAEEVLSKDIDTNMLKKFIDNYEPQIPPNVGLQFSNFNIDLSSISNEEAQNYLYAIIYFLQDQTSLRREWSLDDTKEISIRLIMARNAAEKIDRVDLFYLALGIFLDFISKMNPETARHMTEESLLSSFKNHKQEYGFFLFFKLYSNQGSFFASLLFLNLSMYAALSSKTQNIQAKFLKEIISQSIIAFRNFNLFPIVQFIYNNIPGNLNFQQFETDFLDRTYLTCVLSAKGNNFPEILVDYLNKNEKRIIAEKDVAAGRSLLAMMYNVINLYQLSELQTSIINNNINSFEAIVPVPVYKPFKDAILGNSSELKKRFKEELIKLSNNSSKSSFAYDNRLAMSIADRLIASSNSGKDVEAYLLSMLVKADYSLISKDKEPALFARINLPKTDIENFTNYYPDPKILVAEFSLKNGESIWWLGCSDKSAYHLQYSGEYEITELEKWNPATYGHWTQNDLEKLVKDDGSFQEEKKIKNDLGFAKVPSETFNSIFLVKDMRLSEFPHNLLLDHNSNFISSRTPIANIVSLEWQKDRKDKFEDLKNNYSKGIWIPIDNGDATLKEVFSNLKKTIDKYNFNIYRDIANFPMSNDINILVAHGDKNISDFHAFYINDSVNEKTDFESSPIVGKGKILILFVCYAGTMRQSTFGHSTSSLVHSFFEKGYETVIAPYWSLRIDILPIWLPVFLENFNMGESILNSYHRANLAVKVKFPSPAAWACLHLTGNPNCRVKC